MLKHGLMGKFLTPDEREELKKQFRLEKIGRRMDRIRVVLALDEDWVHKTIAKILVLDEGTVSNHRKRYEERGLESLVGDNHKGKKPNLSPGELKRLSADLQTKIFPNTKMVVSHTRKKFGVEYSRSGMTKLLRRLGFSFKKATPVPGKANRKEQEKFVRKYLAKRGRGAHLLRRRLPSGIRPRHIVRLDKKGGAVRGGDQFRPDGAKGSTFSGRSTSTAWTR